MLGAFVFCLACFWLMLTNYSLTIDEETWINGTTSPQAWISQGRFGITLLDMIFFPDGSYPPIAGDWLAVCLWFLSGPVFLYSLRRYFPQPGGLACFVFCAYFSSLPFTTGEILSYSMFNIQIAIAMLCTAVCCLLLSCRPRKCLFLCGLVLLFAALSVYQTFINVFITWCSACLFLDVERGGFCKENLRCYTCRLSLGLLATLLYAGVSYLLNQKLMANSGYLSENYIGWTRHSNPFIALFMTLANVVRVSFSIPMMDHFIYGGAAICLTTVLFILILLRKTVLLKSVFGFSLPLTGALLAASPFALFIALGTHNTPGRSLLGLSLLGATQWMYILSQPLSPKKDRGIRLLMTAVLVYNAVAMNRLFFDSIKLYQYDRETTQAIIRDMEALDIDYTGKPVVFIGMYDTHPEETLAFSGSTGGSFWNWDDGSNDRMVNFMQAEGYSVRHSSPAQRQQALAMTNSMSPWPGQNSITDAGGFVVAFFSEPTENWYQNNRIVASGKR